MAWKIFISLVFREKKLISSLHNLSRHLFKAPSKYNYDRNIQVCVWRSADKFFNIWMIWAEKTYQWSFWTFLRTVSSPVVAETVRMMKSLPAPSSKDSHSLWDFSLLKLDTSTQHLHGERVRRMKSLPAPSSKDNHSLWDFSLLKLDTSTQHLRG